MTVSAATRVMLLFSIGGWAPLDLAGGQMLTSIRDLAAEGADPPLPPSPVFIGSQGKACVGIRLVEISRAWVGPKQARSSSLGPQTGGVPRSRGLIPGPHLERGTEGPWGHETGESQPCGLSLSSTLQPGEEMEACEELALALSRGLQLDTQRSSRDSLQCSSGYSTQTTTPCCSEDTIPSQGTRQLGFPGRAVRKREALSRGRRGRGVL